MSSTTSTIGRVMSKQIDYGTTDGDQLAPEKEVGGSQAPKGGGSAVLSTPTTISTPSRRDKHTISETNGLVNLLKGNVGTGVLALPQGLHYAGLWVGLVGIPMMGVLSVHCMHLLLQSSRELCRREKVDSLSLEETTEVAFATGPPPLRRLTASVTSLMKLFLVLAQIGFCCVYYDFVTLNVRQLVECSVPGGTGLTQPLYNLMLLPALLAICSIRQLKGIGYLSFVSGVCQAVSLAIILYYCTRDLAQHPTASRPGFAGWGTMPLFFATAVFTFEGIGLMLPIENKMSNPSSFGGTFGVLNTGMVLVVCLYTAVGFYGYLQYGDDIKGSITLNLPSDEMLSLLVKALASAAIFLSYPLQLYVPVQVFLEAGLVKDHDSGLVRLAKDYGVRVSIILLTFGLATAIPNIGLFISLVGAVCSSSIALILPPVVHQITFWPDTGRYNSTLIKAILISGFGLMGMVSGTFTSIVAISQFFQTYANSTQLHCG